MVDDSSDATFGDLRTMFRDDPAIRIIRGPGRGDAVARRLGVAEAEGPFIAFLDSDDEWLPQHLSEHLALWSRFPTIAFSWNADAVTIGDGKFRVPFDHPFRRGVAFIDSGQLASRLIVRNLVDISSVVARKQLIEEAGGFPVDHPCDWRLWVALSQVAGAAYSERILTLHHEDATDRLGHSRRVRIRDAIGTYAFGLQKLLEYHLNGPGTVVRWFYERSKDFLVAGLPTGTLEDLKRLKDYYVNFDANLTEVR
jgi:glycosyltransferase involved in cell wall biosynthesis